MANARGGLLLSRAYLGDATKLRFRCAAGHVWEQTPSAVKQGKWCSLCARIRGARRQSSEARARLYRIVARKRGTVVSREYINSQTRQRYRCHAGHEWVTVPESIIQGSWCPVCPHPHRLEINAARRQVVARRLERRVERSGGRIVPPGFRHSKKSFEVRCGRGHVWQTTAESIDAGVWCPICKEASTLADLRSLAERWGGELLSQRYRGGPAKLEWRCPQGHRFLKTAAMVKGGGWCWRCRSLLPGDLERMRRVARERGGECQSPRYGGAATKLRWRCREGHEWRAVPGSIIQGTWCPICRVRGGHSLARLSIEIMRELATERGGLCLSKEYHASKVALRWRCARGHTWSALPFNVRKGGWCPTCAHSARGTLEGMRALAIERGGRCLTSTWDDHRRPLRFECARGHRFSTLAGVIKTGMWCTKCAAR
jgi:hypothetical protein